MWVWVRAHARVNMRVRHVYECMHIAVCGCVGVWVCGCVCAGFVCRLCGFSNLSKLGMLGFAMYICIVVVGCIN